LENIQYEKYDWNNCMDLKGINLLLGLQLAYTKCCRFLCQWDNRDKKTSLDPKTVAKTRIAYLRVEKCSNVSLNNTETVYLPPQHIKLGLKKTSVKLMDQNSFGFMYLKNKLPRIMDAKINEGVFVDLKYEH
jgi:hypothetical protein